MTQKFEQELIKIIEEDQWMIDILKAVRSLNLNDCWVGAGFVRNKIWDYKHQKTRTKLNDIDVIFFDATNTTKKYESELENELNMIQPNLNWSVKNQARMHLRNGHQPYKNSLDAISYWSETATSIAVRLNPENQIEYIAPHGLEDLFQLVVRPVPNFDFEIYLQRVKSKKWHLQWNKLDIKMEV